MIKIRQSEPHDGDAVLAIWRAAVDATHDFLTRADRTAIEAEVAAFLPGAPLLLATDEAGQVLGFMFLNDGHMEALFVDPAHHGRGVGRTLVSHALQIHPALSTDVNEQNVQATGFYLAQGFKPVGRSPLDGQGRPYPLVHLRYGGAV